MSVVQQPRGEAGGGGVAAHLQCALCGNFAKSHAYQLSHMAFAHPTYLDGMAMGRLGNIVMYQSGVHLFHCAECFFTSRDFNKLYQHIIAKHCLDEAAAAAGGGADAEDNGSEKGDKEADEEAKEADEEVKEADEEAKEADEEAKEANEEAKEADKEVKEANEEAKEADEEVKEANEEAKEANENPKEADEEAKEADEEAKEADEEVKEAKEANKEVKEANEEAKEADEEVKEANEEAKEADEEVKEANEEAKEADEEANEEAKEANEDPKEADEEDEATPPRPNRSVEVKDEDGASERPICDADESVLLFDGDMYHCLICGCWKNRLKGSAITHVVRKHSIPRAFTAQRIRLDDLAPNSAFTPKRHPSGGAEEEEEDGLSADLLKEEMEALAKVVHFRSNRYVCVICGWKTKMKGFAISHVVRCHDVARPYGCKDCAAAFFLPSRLRQHVRAAHRPGRYACPFCSFRSHFLAGFRRHCSRCTAREEGGGGGGGGGGVGVGGGGVGLLMGEEGRGAAVVKEESKETRAGRKRARRLIEEAGDEDELMF